MIGAGFYEDSYAREAGVWRFRRRKLNMDYFVPIAEGWAAGAAAAS